MRGIANTVGIDQLMEMLGDLAERTPEIAAMALYKGAGIVADRYSAAAASVTAKERGPGEDRKTARYPTPDEKGAMQDCIGIANFRHYGGAEVDTLIGVGQGDGGYAEVDGKDKAAMMIARAVNSGTYFMHKQPVFRKAARMCKDEAARAVVAEAERLINEIIK